MPPRIAIASSGLGHVTRGVETWALDTAHALRERGADVRLFGAFGEATPPEGASSLPCLRRNDPANAACLKHLPRWIWRIGITGDYGLEQWTFWKNLWPVLRRERFDILHVQDPMLALWCRRFRRLGLVKTTEILAHGTEEPPEFLKNFPYVQHLAPWHLEQTVAQLDAQAGAKSSGWRAIPNFVDTEVFAPAEKRKERLHTRRAWRKKLGIPDDALVCLCVAAVKCFHKRIDYLIDEFAAAAAQGSPHHLIIAGARDRETDALLQKAQAIGGGHIHIVLDQPRSVMPELYNSADAFVLSSLFEMMPIAILEAMASGLPLILNEHPVLAWMGEGCSMRPDLLQKGALAAAFSALSADWCAATGKLSRERALNEFSVDAVTDRYLDYYRDICRPRNP